MLRLREVWLVALLSVVGCSGSGTEDADSAPGGAAGTGAGGTSAGKGGIGGGAGAAGFSGGSAGASAGSGGLGGGAGGSAAGGAGAPGGKGGASGAGGKGGASGSICGVPCTGTGCAPQPLFTDPFHRFAQLSGDAGSLVWVDEGSTVGAGAPSVLTMPKGGGKPETVAGPFKKSARSPVLTSGGVYFLEHRSG